MKVKTALLLFSISFLFISASHSPNSMDKLMKQMLKYIKQEKEQIEANRPQLKLPTGIKQVRSAKIHPGKKTSDKHQDYVNEFVKELNIYQQVKDSAERKNAFNAMVNSCIACHKHECPGPIQVIEKNLFKE